MSSFSSFLDFEEKSSHPMVSAGSTSSGNDVEVGRLLLLNAETGVIL